MSERNKEEMLMKAKTKLNSLLSMLIALAMLLGMLSAMSLTAFAAEPGISITGSTADSSGTGWSYVESTKTLTLSGYNGGYIQGSGLNTLNLVLEGTSTITVNDANAKGIALDNNQNLNISGSGSLTINATGGSNLIYGIECNKFTMTSGTVTINANSSKMVYGVNANSSLSVTDGKLTANITGTSDGRGLYCKTGKLTVGSGAEVDVTVTNNGSNIMHGIYNNAYTASVTDNGDIELAGTVTITRDGGSTGSGNVYGIANSGSNRNTDGVISITGGSVTVTDVYYGIAAFTKGHDAAFADVVISGGTVNVTSTTSDSLGIVSWNNGVTISGGTVTANTASSALWLFDQDSANKTGLVKITGDAKVSLTSTDYKALVVQEGGSTSSTRVHQINLTSGGSVTVKSTSSEETDYAFPVQGYFNLGSSTKITEGSFRSTPDGTNAGGGKLFQADSTTKQVVVAYSTLYTNAGAVSVNGHSFASDKLYYKNGSADTTNDSTDYNAHYDPATGILELKNYNSGPIIIGSSNAYDVTVKLTGTNTVTTSAPKEGVGNVCVGINITNADNVTFIGDGTLTVNTNAGSGLTQVFGIWLDRSAPAAENLTFQSGKVTVNVTAADTEAQVFGVSTVKVSAGGPITVAEGAELNVTLSSASIGLANGLRSKGNITLNGKTAITLTYTGSGSPSASNWTSVSGFSGDNKLNVGANAAITVNMPDTYSLTNGMGSAYYAAKSDSKIEDEDWTNAAGSEQYFENDSFLVTQSVQSGLGYADYKYEVITPLTFEDKADYDIPAGTKGTGYTATVALTATGGSGEYRYEFEGTKPSGLSINAENKLVYTRASVCDATTAIVKVTDKGGISKSITIDIGAVTATSPGTGTVPHIDNKTVPVGTDVTVPWPEGAISYQRFEDSTQVGSGDKSGYPSGMYIPAKSSPTTKTFMFKVLFPGGWGYSNDFTVTWTTSAIYTVTINAGANMTLASGNANQSGLSGAMTDTVYTAADGYYFPTDYSVSAVNGITVTRNSYTQITVSGTPTANTTITLTPATAKTKEATPTATFDAQGPDFGNLMNWPTGMKYSVDGGVTWTENTSSYDYKAIYNVLADKDIKVYKPASDPNTKLDSDIQTIDVTKAATPTGVTGVACTTSANNDGKLQNVTTAMQYKKSDTSTWTDCGGTEVTGLANGTYYVRIKYSGTVLASDNQTVTVAAYTAPKTLSSIAVTTAPAKVTYTAGEYFNTSGMVVTATYSDSSTKAVTSYTFAPTEALTTGDTSITISYTEGGVTKTATQAITVNAATKTLSSIAVTTAPTKVTYTAGEYFNTSGMVVTATYSDSSTKAVTGYTFTPTGALTTGDASITISYTEGGVTKTATQAITVNAVLSEFTITFDGNGGTPSVSGMTTTDQKLAALPTATRSGSYSFKGWYTAASGGTKITTDTVFSENTTVYAQWTYSGGGGGGGRRTSRYTVSFESNGGSKVASQSVTRNTVMKEPTAPTKENFDFDGWYSDKELKTKYDFSAKVTKSFTLYAKWTEKDNSINQIILTIGKKDAQVFGKSKSNDVAPKIEKDRTMLPARFVAENLGAKVEWNGEKELVTITGKNLKTDENVTILITIGAATAKVNGKEIKLDSPAFIENDRTYTPIRFISEELGASVEWVEKDKKVIITKPEIKKAETK